MSNPLLNKKELRRLPFQRRPVAEPGTRLVFQMSSGQLVSPDHPFTSGDVWWRGPRTVYVVDSRPHSASFECTLPCAGDALHFDASITYTWTAYAPVTVVREKVENPPADCRGHLIQRMRKVSRQYPALNIAAAERAVSLDTDGSIDLDERGLRITNVTVELRLDPAQAPIAKDLEIASLRQRLAEEEERGKAAISRIAQESDLKLHEVRTKFYTDILSSGPASMAGNLLAQDPTKAAEAADFMLGLWQRDQEVALKAMKVILDSDQLRAGEIDGAVSAAVDSFTALVTQAGNKLALGALTGGRPMVSAAAEKRDDYPATGSPADIDEPGAGDGPVDETGIQ